MVEDRVENGLEVKIQVSSTHENVNRQTKVSAVSVFTESLEDS